jgi:hypothetical protein
MITTLHLHDGTDLDYRLPPSPVFSVVIRNKHASCIVWYGVGMVCMHLAAPKEGDTAY